VNGIRVPTPASFGHQHACERDPSHNPGLIRTANGLGMESESEFTSHSDTEWARDWNPSHNPGLIRTQIPNPLLIGTRFSNSIAFLVQIQKRIFIVEALIYSQALGRFR
jgi:hypothetical protein